MRHVVFQLERDRYALPLAAVREVVAAPAAYTRVPRAPAWVLGVMNLRGRVVPVVALGPLLGLGGGGGGKVVLLDRGRHELGLLVTDVDGIEALDKVGGARTSPMVRGLARLGALAITVLDADGLDGAVAQAIASR